MMPFMQDAALDNASFEQQALELLKKEKEDEAFTCARYKEHILELEEKIAA